jgi:hypothetical protein
VTWIRRQVLVLGVLSGLCAGIGLLLMWARGDSATHSITLAFYVGGALAIVGSMFPRSNVTRMAYARNLDVKVLDVPFADRVGNLAVGIGLLVLGGVLDALSR